MTIFHIASLILTSFLIASVVLKFFDFDNFVDTVSEIVNTQRFGLHFSWIVLVFEAVIILLLMMPQTVFWGGIFSLMLFACFNGAIVYAKRKGWSVDCRCFGKFSAAPAGNGALIRNSILILLSCLLIWSSMFRELPITPFDSFYWAISETSNTAYALYLAIACVLIAFQFQLFQQQGRVIIRLETLESQLSQIMPASLPGLAPGETVPDVTLLTLEGEPIGLAEICGKLDQTLLLFFDPTCSSCSGLIADIKAAQLKEKGITTVIISRGTVEQNYDKFADDSVSILLQEHFEAAEAFKIPGTPSGVLIDSQGLVASQIAAGGQAILSFVRTVAQRHKILSPSDNSIDGSDFVERPLKAS